MKVKGLALFLVVALIAGMSVSAFAAANNPFSDVPANHWAYDSIITLAAVGLVEGYPDGTYGGSRMLTRYEAAMVFARTLARLESLVASEVASSTAGVRKDITAEVLKDIEAAKANLTQLIKDELAKIEVPVVEKVVVEQPIENIVERQPIERPFVMTPEAEAVIADLVAQLAGKHLAEAETAVQETVVETKIIERIVEAEGAIDEEQVRAIVEELLAYHLSELDVQIDQALRENVNQDRRIDELEAAINGRLRDLANGQEALAGDIAYVEYRVLGLVDGVRNDLTGLQEQLDAHVEELANSITDLTNELEIELALLGVRVDELEALFANLDGRVTALEAGHAALKEEVERVKFSGTLNFDAEKTVTEQNDAPVVGVVDTYLGDEDYTEADLAFTQEYDLKLTVKASDSVTVNAFLTGEFDFDAVTNPDTYGLEVLSDSFLNRAVIGSLDKDEIADRFKTNVLASGIRPQLGLLADYAAGNFSGSLLAGQVDADDEVLAGTLKLAFMPELGFKGAVTSIHEEDFTLAAASAGVFGEIAGVAYDATYALDLPGEEGLEDNSRIDASASTTVGPLTLKGAWSKVAANFGDSGFVSRGLVDGDNETRLELNASAELVGVELGVDWYKESAELALADIEATRLTAAYKLDLFLPFEFSAALANNKTVGADDQAHRELKVAINDFEIGSTNLTVGSSFALVTNYLDDNWKATGDYTELDANILTADLGYATALAGSEVTLGYGYQLVLPQNDDDASNETTHTLTAGYGFTDSMKLNLTAERFSDSPEVEADKITVNKVSAGVEFKF